MNTLPVNICWDFCPSVLQALGLDWHLKKTSLIHFSIFDPLLYLNWVNFGLVSEVVAGSWRATGLVMEVVSEMMWLLRTQCGKEDVSLLYQQSLRLRELSWCSSHNCSLKSGQGPTSCPSSSTSSLLVTPLLSSQLKTTNTYPFDTCSFQSLLSYYFLISKI